MGGHRARGGRAVLHYLARQPAAGWSTGPRRSGGIVYHDVTNRSWAEKAAQNGVRGLIAVNSEAGGHPGKLGPRALLDEVAPLGLPVVCAGGVGDARAFRAMMDLGYDGVQLGTRFIASAECRAHPDYKQAIVSAEAKDIVLTERLTGASGRRPEQ